MEAALKIMVDPVIGIEWRAVERVDGRGWTAQWRPARALKAFPCFSYRSRREGFATAQEAVDFIRIHASEIFAGRI